MSSTEILLRQRYSLSFFTTTLLIALTTESSLAFSITAPTEYSPVEIYNTYNNNSSYVGTVTLYPDITSITRGGTTGFLQTLSQAFQDWTFNPAPSDLAGSFQVEKYLAKYTVIESTPVVGGEIKLLYKPGDGDPILDNSLKWIQRVVNNHSATPNVHGNNADIIDNLSNPNAPYYPYNTESQGFRSFYDFSRRSDPAENHNWLAELYLVKETAPKQVTIYNGIQWGWSNTAQPVPEPLTIFASGVCLGFGALFKKTVKETGQNKTKSLQKVKN
jgi:hypothetical protein